MSQKRNVTLEMSKRNVILRNKSNYSVILKKRKRKRQNQAANQDNNLMRSYSWLYQQYIYQFDHDREEMKYRVPFSITTHIRFPRHENDMFVMGSVELLDCQLEIPNFLQSACAAINVYGQPSIYTILQIVQKNWLFCFFLQVKKEKIQIHVLFCGRTH